MAFIHRHHRFRAAAVLLAVLVAAVAMALLLNRRDPSRISQQSLYLLGTRASAAAVSPLPRQRRVVIPPLGWSELSAALVDLLPGGPPPREFIEQGTYDPVSGTILLDGVFVRFQASLRVAWLQSTFRHVLRHEYGHALLADWLTRNGDSEQAALPFTTSPEANRPARYPVGIQGVVREFDSQPREVYGQRYFRQAFAEYFAESYARFLEGDEVPPRMERFLEAQSAAWSR